MFDSLIARLPARSIPYARWAAWVLASALTGGLAVLLVAASPGGPGSQSSLLFAPAFAILTALGQGLVLDRRIGGWWRWLLISIASWGAPLFLNGLMTLTLPDAFLASLSTRDALVVIGFGTGLVQAYFLRPFFRWSSLWLLASILGWIALALLAGEAFTTPQLVLFALVPPIFTGAALAWLWERRPARLKPDGKVFDEY